MATLSKHDVPLGGVIVNQVLPSPTDGGVEDPFFMKRRLREEIHLARISKHLGHWPIRFVTLQDSDPVGVEELRKINVQLTPMEACR